MEKVIYLKRYMIVRKIGSGATSEVYLARDLTKNTNVAVKIIDRHVIAKTETELIRDLYHPALPHILKVWEDDDFTYVVMDYVKGKSLKDVLLHERSGTDCVVWKRQVIDWGKQLCKVLFYLHSQNPPLVYRDLKPDNIILQDNGKVKLVDFGAVMQKKAGRGNDCLGTRGYAAPEQYKRKGRIDARTDIYCLGKTLEHLWSGQIPMKIGEKKGRVYSGTDSEFRKIIKRCTMCLPCMRYQSCREVLRDLDALKM